MGHASEPEAVLSHQYTSFTSIFYIDLLLVFISLSLSISCLLVPRLPLLLWLPALLVILWNILSLSALISLNNGLAYRSRNHLLCFILLSFILIILRLFTAVLFLLSLFSPHSISWISASLVTVLLIDVCFGFISATKVLSFRNNQFNKRNTVGDGKIEEIAVDTLLSHAASQHTVFTVVDEPSSSS